KPGSGPRHLTFHPSLRVAYLVHELSGDITALQFENGKFSELQNMSPVKDHKGKTDAADIRISPDGKFLYASYRGDLNELVIYSINAKDGTLTAAGKQATGGTGPRNFTIDPSGNFLLVAHQKSNDITIFSRNKQTGQLTPLAGKRIAVDSPVCLVFVKAD
ncbi:MAG TPA: beta-propeller fold lactonase family protein, partial [Sphingobacteriaceae bacterium]